MTAPTNIFYNATPLFAPIEGSRQRSRLWGSLFAFSYDCNFLSYRFPPLRHFVTPLLKERLFVRLPLRGAGNAVDCGVACSYFHMTVIFYRIIFHRSVTSWHLSLRRGFCTAPIEGEPMTQLTVGWLIRIFIWLLFFIVSFTTTPSLRDTSPQGEAFVWLPLRGAVNAVDCGVAFYNFNTSLLIF